MPVSCESWLQFANSVAIEVHVRSHSFCQSTPVLATYDSWETSMGGCATGVPPACRRAASTMTRSSGDPEYGLLPASTKFERDWIAYEAEAQAAHEEQAQAHVAPAEEQEREPTSTLPKPASTLPVKVAMAMAEVAKLNAHLSTRTSTPCAHHPGATRAHRCRMCGDATACVEDGATAGDLTGAREETLHNRARCTGRYQRAHKDRQRVGVSSRC